MNDLCATYTSVRCSEIANSVRCSFAIILCVCVAQLNRYFVSCSVLSPSNRDYIFLEFYGKVLIKRSTGAVMSSDTPPNGNAMDSNTSRFSLDGIVAEMVIEVDEENNSLPSPSKLFNVNGLDDHEKLKSSDSTKCSATLDLEIIKEISTNIENPQSKETVCKSSEASESKDKVQESEILIKAEIKLENLNEKDHNLSENIINELVEIKKELVDESDMNVVSENKEKVTESEKMSHWKVQQMKKSHQKLILLKLKEQKLD
ncbi:hypothetical protein CEXT_437171 [Caerostris extrusa]|uniref:Uncharacterized protein n=1 Tax=Caerostris extrusa TaxID=172846 RepID=A0AAV4RTQ0_CAEEX|nr:hypothetical protein CEXT_437171 [Caerostris extrusa]